MHKKALESEVSVRYSLLIALCSTTLAQPPDLLLTGRKVTGLAVSGDAILADTSAGLFWIERYSVREAASGDRPDRMALSIRHAGFAWRATASGIERRRLKPAFTRYVPPHSDRVHALAMAPDGSIWCGTEHGVVRFLDGRFETMQRELGLVTAVAVDRQGAVWIGSGSKFTGVYRYDGKRWQKIAGLDAHVHNISLDPAGTLWFATLGDPDDDPTAGLGAWYWADGGFRQADWLGSTRVYDVAAQDPGGVQWFATLKGLVAYKGEGTVRRYTPQTGELSREKVWCLSAASDGSLWVGYGKGGGGASRIAGGAITHFRQADGLCSDKVWAVEEGRSGVLWFSTNAGLTRYDGRRWSCFKFSQAALWPLLPDADGALWIGTLGDGLWRFVPSDKTPPRTVVAVEGNEVSWTATDAWFDTPKDEIWFRYRSVGGRWSRAVRGVGGLALGPGRHVIEVQSIDRFGNAQDPPVRVSVTVDQERETPWIWIVLAAALVIGWIALQRGSG